jgi:DNA-binding transcriptional ArsR family regulator
MGASKSDQFSKKHNQMANVLKALAHPARVAIVEYLLSVDACICGDIVNELPLAQPTISRHLKELKQAGLIQGEIQGTAICYCLNPKTVQMLIEYFDRMHKRLLKLKTCC